jgi:hypothetical protein
MDVTSAWGVLFESTIVEESFPVGLFVDTPNTVLAGAAYNYAVMLEYMGAGDKTKTPQWCAVRPNSMPGVSFYMTYHSVGRWK